MPLVLSFHKGEDFYVGDERFVVTEVFAEPHCQVTRESTNRTFDVMDSRSTEVMPDVFVSAGSKPAEKLARLTIEAPPTLRILRGDRYRNPPAHIRKVRGK